MGSESTHLRAIFSVGLIYVCFACRFRSMKTPNVCLSNLFE
ncbi:hypothetical protein Hhis01_03530 [Haloarcula hispanica]